MIISLFFIAGCIPDENLITENQLLEEKQIENQSDPNQVEIAKEFSLIIGGLMEEKSHRLELTQLVEWLDSFADQVTIAAIFGNTQKMGDSEVAKWGKLQNTLKLRKNVSSLANAIAEQTLQNMDDYKFIKNTFDPYFAKLSAENGNVSQKEALKNYFSEQGLVVHIPYEEKFDWENYQGAITTTYDPIIRDDWNEGYLFNTSGSRINVSTRTLVPMVDDDYSYANPTLVVTYFYEDDFMAAPPEPTLPTPSANSVLLTYNVNHTSISQADILASNIPKMRLTSNDYVGLFGGKTKVRLYRGSSAIKVNFDGTVGSSADGKTFRYDRIEFSKDDARYERWKDVNIQWDPDWDVTENSQEIFLFTEHTFVGKAKANASVKVGYDFIKKEPTFNFTTTADVSVELGGSKFHINGELSRRAVLSTIIGDTGNGVYPLNSVDYNVKPIGHLEYFFLHRFTDIPD